MRSDRSALLLCALACLLSGFLLLQPARAGEPQFAKEKPGQWTLRDTSLPPGVVTLSVKDGQTSQFITLTPKATQADEHWIAEGDGIRLERSLDQAGNLTICQITVRNIGDQQRWLEPAINLTLDRSNTEGLTYWDGGKVEQPLHELAASSQSLIANSIKGRMPIAGVYNEQVGVAIGQHPLDIFSYSSSELTFSNAKATLRLAVRTVLEPKAEATIRFVLGGYDARFGGQRAMIQTYHDAFAHAFSPNDKVHRYLRQASSHYQMYHVAMDQTLEKMRRFHTGWEWAYAPFKRTGDAWGDPSLWDYKPYAGKFTPRVKFMEMVDFNTISLDDFHALRSRYYNTWGQLFGLLWYSPAGSWIEKDLALARYADAQIIDPNVRYELTSWVTGHDKEVLVLPWFTSYEPVLRENYRRIAESYNTTGIAMDVARGGPRYRGPAIKKDLPIRAYDEQGIFIDQGVAVAKFIDYLHTLPVRFSPEHRLGVIGNPETGGQTFMTSVRFDAGMFEGQPYHHNKEAIPSIRYALGQKPLTWWKGWAYHNDLVPDWRNRDQRHFTKTMNRLVDYVIFQSYQWAAIPTANYQWGISRLSHQMPLLLDTIELGWQARFPVDTTFDGLLYNARYGKGIHTRFFWGNPYEQGRKLTADIHCKYLGSASYAFADLANPGSTTRNQLADGVTHLDMTLPARLPIVHQAAIGFTASDFAADVETTFQSDTTSRTFDIRVTPTTATSSAIVFPQLAGYQLASASINGKPITLNKTDKLYVTPDEHAWSLSEHTINVRYQSEFLHLTAEQLASFDFLSQDNKPQFTLVLQGKDADSVAERIRQFFGLYVKLTAKQASLELPVTDDPATIATPGRIILEIDRTASAGSVSMPDAATLLVQGRDFETLDRAVLTFLAALEDRFACHPPLRGTWGTSSELLRHYGLSGEQLPEDAR